MKFVWIIFIIIAIEQMIYHNIQKDKKEVIIYYLIVLISVFLCISYYSDEYGKSILGIVNDKINLERFVWIKQRTK